MGRLVSRIFGLGKKSSNHYLNKYDEIIRQELIRINIQRERILAIILSFLQVIVIGRVLTVDNSTILNEHIFGDSIFIHFILINLSVLFIVYTQNLKEISKFSITKLNCLHKIMIFSVMIISAAAAIKDHISNQQPFAYIMAMYSLSSMIVLDEIEGLTVYLLSYIIYAAGIIGFQGITLKSMENIIITLILLMLALAISRTSYSSFVSNYINRMLIQEKNQQLDNMYKTVETALTMRTEHLNHTLEIDKVKTAFFSNISHELRTPLNIIFSAEQMLQLIFREENIQNRKQDILKYNNMVQQNCYRLIRLVENLIDITEIDAGINNINLEKHDIVKLVKDVTLSTAEYIEGRDVTLTFHSDLEHRVICCDSEKIERVILNLLSNAVKFSLAGGNIQVGVYEKGGKIIINVRDNGIGIPQEKRNLIFERFAQVDQSTTRLREGCGIGLAIVKAFVEQHGGEIELISTEGQGSEFILSLPANLCLCKENYKEGISCLTREYKCYEKVKMEFSDLYDTV